MSADHEISLKGHVNWRNFYVRRLFRIAPAYYLAAIVFVALDSTRYREASGVLAFVTFANTWVLSDVGQGLVPGAWSISVEFMFYLALPAVIRFCGTVPRAIALLCASVATAVAINTLVPLLQSDDISRTRIADFLYFSIWNQLPVFAIGNVLYVGWYRRRVAEIESTLYQPNAPGRQSVDRRLMLLSLVGLVFIAFIPLPRAFDSSLIPPSFFVTSLLLAVFSLSVVSDQPRWVVNASVAAIGRVSFSAYLAHWIVLDVLKTSPAGEWLAAQSRFTSIAGYFAATLLVATTTWLIASVTYKWIEKPGMQLGRYAASLNVNHGSAVKQVIS